MDWVQKTGFQVLKVRNAGEKIGLGNLNNDFFHFLPNRIDTTFKIPYLPK